MGELMERRLQLVRGTDGWIAHLEWRGQWITASGPTEAGALRSAADRLDAAELVLDFQAGMESIHALMEGEDVAPEAPSSERVEAIREVLGAVDLALVQLGQAQSVDADWAHHIVSAVLDRFRQEVSRG